MLNLRKDLIKKNLDFKNYDNNEIKDIIECSYILGRKSLTEDLDFENIDTYTAFVKLCYEMYNNNYRYGYIGDYIEDNIEEIIEEFKKKYIIKNNIN